MSAFQDKLKVPEVFAPETFLFPECLIFRLMDKIPMVFIFKEQIYLKLKD
ncbi:hypothetical protein GCM10022217_37220 [Chryseobacterium ginsenosidimutans]